MSTSDESFEYVHDSSAGSLDSFIDDNNYDYSDQDMDHSVEIIDDDQNSETDIEVDNNLNDDINRNDEQINTVNEEVGEMPKTEIKEESTDRRITYSQSADNIDNCCLICTEMWTTTAEHQLVSLNCGHLFGRSCIEKWLMPSRHTQRCPQCNKAAKKKDIRVIYARNLCALDTSERDRAFELLEKERQLRKKLESEAIENSIKLKSILRENERLKKEYMECQLKVQQLSSCSRNTEKVISNQTFKAINNKIDAFEYIRDIEINSSGDCRLLGYSSLFEVIAVSQPNSNSHLFPGYGVKKIFLNDFSKTDNICIHTKCIKDLEINAYDGTILTSSLDKTVKLSSLLSKSSIMSYNLEVEAWSVAFNPKNKHEFYAGLRNGQILLFDKRMMSSHVDHLESPTKTPVVSLNYIDYSSPIGQINGILSTQLHTFSLHERLNSSDNITSTNFSMINIPFEGIFNSAHFEPKSGLTLLSCRPSTKHMKKATHYVMDLSIRINENNERVINPNVIEFFEGGTEQVQLSRSRIFAHPFNENSALICAGDESAKGALIWDLSSSSCVQKLKTESPILDMSLLHCFNNNSYFLTALTGKSLKVYKCNS